MFIIASVYFCFIFKIIILTIKIIPVYATRIEAKLRKILRYNKENKNNL